MMAIFPREPPNPTSQRSFMPNLSQLLTLVRRVAIPGLLTLVIFACPAFAQDSTNEFEVSVGVGGVAKLGHWLPVHFRVPSDSPAANADRFRVTVLDGDDTPSTTTGTLTKNKTVFEGLIQIGRTYGTAKFELLNGEEVLATVDSQVRQENNQFMELLPSTARVFACIEPVIDEEETGALVMMADCLDVAFPGGVNPEDRVASVYSPDELPRKEVAYGGCESVVLLVNQEDWIAQFSTDAVDALEAWVRNGGHLVLAVSPDLAAPFQQGGILQRFAPGKVTGPVDVDSSRRLAEFCKSKEPFLKRGDTMQVLNIEDVQGRIALAQGKQALIVRSSLGLGEVTFVAVDPTSQQFQEWKAGRRFMQNLMQMRFGTDAAQPASNSRTGTAVRHSGFDDMVGQMKVPLERFNNLRFIRFELIALLIALYILCIGLGDWFLVGKVFKKHELTWITFPLLAALFCGIAWYAAIGSRPGSIQVNQIELIDIDSVEGDIRTTTWANLYSPRRRTVNLSLGVGKAAEDHGLELESSQLTWLGLPGDGLGGMLNRANPGLYRTGYTQDVTSVESQGAEVNIDLKEVELQVSSTRPLLGTWHGRYQNRVVSRLRATDRLEGTFTNPFDVPLKDAAIFFQDRVYMISGTFPADGDIDIRSDTTEKTIRSFLTRRTRRIDDKNKSQSVSWDTSDVDLNRIMQMMMFYHGSGGIGYTGLSHAYHDFIEMTPQCSLNRAILVGRMSDRVSAIELDGQDADELYDSSLTLVRVLMPVEPKNETRNK